MSNFEKGSLVDLLQIAGDCEAKNKYNGSRRVHSARHDYIHWDHICTARNNTC